MKNTTKLIVSISICELAGILGSIFTTPAIKSWYFFLKKPFFSPPNWVFAPVWTVLFLLMGISLFLVWKNDSFAVPSRDEGRKRALFLFVLQLLLNILWSIIFFGLKSPGFAFLEILMLWFAILYTIINFYRISKFASFLLLPYIIWVTFAAVLNLAVWTLNI